MEKIIKIEEATFKTNENDWREFIGYQVITNQQTIKVGISDGKSCCEDYGYLITNDDTKDFIGATLLSISIVDVALNNKEIEQLEYLDRGGVMFVNFETSKGLLQLAAYNAHNGYYGHDAVLVSKQLNHEKII
jgi:hypothetical protein